MIVVQERFTRATRRMPCPICGKTKHCSFNSSIAICMKIDQGSIKTIHYSDGREGYLHKLQPNQVQPDHLSPIIEPSSATLANIQHRDRVYRRFLSFLSLNARHKSDLLRRGFTEEIIGRNGYKSIPVSEHPWDICRKLKDCGLHLTGVPGFYKARNRHGGEYWTFSNKPGYFIPIKDVQGRIQALQRRMDDGGDGKYQLFSSNNGTSGTPAHVARPQEKPQASRIWVTESPLKADYLAMKGCLAVASVSATCWKAIIPMLAELQGELGLSDVDVIEAFDMDKETNKDVKAAVFRLRNELSKRGYRVFRAVWEKENGIDDAIQKGCKVYLQGYSN